MAGSSRSMRRVRSGWAGRSIWLVGALRSAGSLRSARSVWLVGGAGSVRSVRSVRSGGSVGLLTPLGGASTGSDGSKRFEHFDCF